MGLLLQGSGTALPEGCGRGQGGMRPALGLASSLGPGCPECPSQSLPLPSWELLLSECFLFLAACGFSKGQSLSSAAILEGS